MIICWSCRAKNPSGVEACAACKADLKKGRSSPPPPILIEDRPSPEARHAQNSEASAALVAELLSDPGGSSEPAMAIGGTLNRGLDAEAILATIPESFTPIPTDAESSPSPVQSISGPAELLPLPEAAPVQSDIPLPSPSASSSPATVDIPLPEPVRSSTDDLPILEPIEDEEAPILEPIEDEEAPILEPIEDEDEEDAMEGELIVESMEKSRDDESMNLPVLSSSDNITPPQAARAPAKPDNPLLERDSRGGRWLTLPGQDEESFIETELEEQKTKARKAEGRSRRGRPAIAEVSVAAASGSGFLDPLPADRVPPMPFVPEVVKTVSGTAGIVGSIKYRLQTHSLVERQKKALKEMGTALAKCKRLEVKTTEALGRAARKNNFTPAELLDAAAAADLEDDAAQSRREQADATQKVQHQASQQYQATQRAGEAQLAKLEEQYAPRVARLQEMQRRRDEASTSFDELAQESERLRIRAETPPTDEEMGGEIRMEGSRIVVEKKSYEEEVAAREAEHQKAILKVGAAKKEIETITMRLGAERGPIKKLEAEMKKVRSSMQVALERLQEAEGRARVAVVAGQRRAEFANRSAAELDAEIGQAILKLSEPSRALEKLLDSVEQSRRQTAKVSERLNAQQDQLELYDEQAARQGTRFLIIGCVLAVLLLVVLLQLSRIFL